MNTFIGGEILKISTIDIQAYKREQTIKRLKKACYPIISLIGDISLAVILLAMFYVLFIGVWAVFA